MISQIAKISQTSLRTLVTMLYVYYKNFFIVKDSNREFKCVNKQFELTAMFGIQLIKSLKVKQENMRSNKFNFR